MLGLSCPAVWGIFPDEESNLHPLYAKWIPYRWATGEVPLYIILKGRELWKASFIIFYFFGCTMWHAGSLFPSPGLNPCPLQWKHSLNHWTTLEGLSLIFKVVFFRFLVVVHLISLPTAMLLLTLFTLPGQVLPCCLPSPFLIFTCP